MPSPGWQLKRNIVYKRGGSSKQCHAERSGILGRSTPNTLT